MSDALRNTRTPEQIIGHDAVTQLIFEGYAVLSMETVSELRECVEASIEGPKRDRKILSRNVGDMVPMPAFILKGQVLRAMRLLREIRALPLSPDGQQALDDVRADAWGDGYDQAIKDDFGSKGYTKNPYRKEKGGE